MPGRARIGRPSRRAVTRVAFGVIIAFVVIQAVWWVVFQHGYVGRISEERMAHWRADAAAAQAAWEAGERDPALRDVLLTHGPHLVFENGAFAVDASRSAAFLDRQRSHLRMFAWEGPFFVLVILAMLALIGRSLHEERALKRSQQNFLSAVTHEFKTPVATLRLLIETTQLRDLASDKRRDYLVRMAGEVDRLERTTEQVLAAARLEAAPVAATLRPMDLRDVTRERVEAMRPGLEARGARLRTVVPDEPLPVSLDADAFSLVLGNLLDNAVKYSRQEVRPVTVRLASERDVVLLHVDDEGVGVPEAERERIFGRFYRSGDESTRLAVGVGLGLHLVKSTVESMNGWIRVTTAPSGRGSRFTVVLPRRVGGGVAPASAGHGAGEAAPAGGAGDERRLAASSPAEERP